MNRIGLDVIKIKSFSSKTSPVKKGNSLPGSIIHSNKSIKKIELQNLINNRDVLIPIKARVCRQSQLQKAEDMNELQFRHLIEMTTSLTNFGPEKEKEDATMFMTSRKKDQNRIFKKERKAEDYLYKRLEGTEKNVKEEQNLVYDKRIKSFLEFLWKNGPKRNYSKK
mgnify:CR=1 FL=1